MAEENKELDPGEDRVEDEEHKEEEKSNELDGAQAKIAELEKHIEELESEVSVLKAKNYDLLMALGEDSEDEDEYPGELPPEDAIDELFTQRGE